jgi:hypothetical protein
MSPLPFDAPPPPPQPRSRRQHNKTGISLRGHITVGDGQSFRRLSRIAGCGLSVIRGEEPQTSKRAKSAPHPAGWRRHAVFWHVCDFQTSQTSQNARSLRHPPVSACEQATEARQKLQSPSIMEFYRVVALCPRLRQKPKWDDVIFQ